MARAGVVFSDDLIGVPALFFVSGQFGLLGISMVPISVCPWFSSLIFQVVLEFLQATLRP